LCIDTPPSRGDFVAHPLARLVEPVLRGFIGFLETAFDAVPSGLASVLDLVKLLVQFFRLVTQGLEFGFRDMDRVYGPDFMLAMCELSVRRGYRNFLLGGKPGVAQALKSSLEMRFPGLNVVGTYTPPFRQLTRE